ncbi:UvrD-helicase domain-containing protein, partial [Methanoregula sp. PtaB.Bin085]|uniref:UvrD-helicase domain-containing protein n=1 Tax=Methanoregula sp. PtaB.Bin085 TaxID=1811680 RepID=UPI0025DCA347
MKNNLDALKLTFNHRNLLPRPLVEQIIPLKTEILAVNEGIVNFNEYFIQTRMNDYQPLFLKSPYPLDENQKRAVIIDDCHNLIVAGAGSGKTEVIINRIAYLTERKPDTVSPERILVLAYQNKAAHEIQERLAERYNINVKIKTFHALGKEICEHASQYLNKEVPRLKFTGDNADYQFSKYISEMFRTSRDDPVFDRLLWNFLFSYGYSSVEKSEEDFTDLQDYYNYVRNLQYTTLGGIKVKSKAECEIFNFYFSHRVNGKPIGIEYESPAKWMAYLDGEGKEKIPQPDFFLPGFDIYHEHWAIDKNGGVPPWFSGKDPQREYTEGMEKKKLKFQGQDKYLLIETSSADYGNDFESVLMKGFENALKKKYPSSEITIEKIPYIKLIGKVWEECRASTNRLDGHIANFISI